MYSFEDEQTKSHPAVVLEWWNADCKKLIQQYLDENGLEICDGDTPKDRNTEPERDMACDDADMDESEFDCITASTTHPREVRDQAISKRLPTTKTTISESESIVIELPSDTESYEIPEIAGESAQAPGNVDMMDAPEEDIPRSANAAKKPSNCIETPDASVEQGGDIETDATVQFCQSVIKKLLADTEDLPARERWNLVSGALTQLLGEIQLNDFAFGELALGLHTVAPQEYGKWVKWHVDRGALFTLSTFPLPARVVSNYLALFRLHLIDELNLDTVHEIALLDGGLAAFADYLTATLEVKMSRQVYEARTTKIAGNHARIQASAHASLKLYLNTLERLRQRLQKPILSVNSADTVVLQANTDEASDGPVTSEGIDGGRLR